MSISHSNNAASLCSSALEPTYEKLVISSKLLEDLSIDISARIKFTGWSQQSLGTVPESVAQNALQTCTNSHTVNYVSFPPSF